MTIRVQSELPPGRTVRDEPVDWAKVKTLMIENEGNWVLVADNVAGSTAAQLREGKNQLFRGADLDAFEFAVRKPEDPNVAATYKKFRTDLWGRYTAPKSKRVTS